MESFFQYSSWKKVWVFLALNFFLQAVIVLFMYPTFSPGVVPLDLRFGLDAASVTQYLTDISAVGRELYLLNEATLDMLFPIAYSLGYGLLLAQIIKACGLQRSVVRFVPILPFALGICDVVENSQIIISILGYPDLSQFSIVLLSVANPAKHVLSGVTIVAILLLLVLLLVKKAGQLFRRVTA